MIVPLFTYFLQDLTRYSFGLEFGSSMLKGSCNFAGQYTIYYPVGKMGAGWQKSSNLLISSSVTTRFVI